MTNHTKIAYVLNTYPMTSTTFITTEINSLEKRGLNIHRFASTPWSEALVSQSDIEEQRRTEYVLHKNLPKIFGSLMLSLLDRPMRLLSAFRRTLQLNGIAQKSIFHHFGYFLQANYIARSCEKKGIEILHAHFGTNATSIAYLASLLTDVDYTFTVHGPNEFDQVSAEEYYLKIKHSKYVFSISHYCTSLLMRLTDSRVDNFQVVRCGIDLNNFSYVGPEDNQTFVCVGRLCSDKAQKLILKALAQVTSDYPKAHIIFVGDGAIRGDMEAYIEAHGLQENVTLAGWKDPKEVKELIGQCRAFLLPSFAEGLPVSIMEAYGMGKPVITTFIAGIPELVNAENGWIVPAGSSNTIAGAMRACLSAPLDTLQEMGRRGRAAVEEHHDTAKQAAQIETIWFGDTA